jgi:hypothetical protein
MQKNFKITLSKVLKEIKREVLPEIKLKEPIIYYGGKSKYLGKFLGFNYSNNKTNKPIIRLNCAECLRSVKKDLSLYDILLTTILHELGHALQEIKGKSFNEREAENFAYDYWRFGQIYKIQ